jgi:diketogulonate reductase-like aldo/keto reductase
MRQHDIPLIAYAPVAKGDKLGSNFANQKVLLEIASNHHCDVFQLLLAWCIRDGKTIAIPQSSNSKHVVNNVAAANIRLTDEEFNQIDSIYGRPVSKQPLALW